MEPRSSQRGPVLFFLVLILVPAAAIIIDLLNGGMGDCADDFFWLANDVLGEAGC